MNKQRAIVAAGLLVAGAVGVGMIVFTISGPTRRTVVIDQSAAKAKRAVKVDEAAATAAFEAQVATYRAAGEPVRAEDLTPQPVEAGTNAAVSLAEAAGILDKFEAANRKHPFWNLDVKPGLSDAQWAMVDGVLTNGLAGVLTKVDEATTRPASVWEVKYVSPLYRTLLPHLNGARGVANIVQAAALSAHRAGRDDEALRRVGELLRIARAVDQQPFIVTHLVALGISRIASDTAAGIVPTLKIGTAPGDASEAQVRALIADFLDDAWAREGLRSAMLAERLGIMDSATCLATKKVTAAEMAKLLSGNSAMPTGEMTPGEAYFDALAMMKMLDPMIAAIRTSQRLGEYQSKQLPPQAPPPSIMGQMMPSVDRVAVTHYTGISRLRQAGAALAVRLWMSDHGGQPPAALSDLVPTYLAAVPLDPLASTEGATLTYKAAPVATVAGVNARPQDRMQMRVGR